MFTRKGKSILWIPFLALFVIMACLPTFGNHQIAQPPNQGESSTLTALSTLQQVIVEIRTFTPTKGPSITPSPIETETPVVTSTLTAVPITPTKTSIPPTATKIIINNANTQASLDYSCEVIKTTPYYGTVFTPGTNFQAIWLVRNTGRKNWDGSSVDYFYESGTDLHVISGYDLQKSLNVGGTREIRVDMEAPKDNGTHTTRWIFQIADEQFCPLTITIIVAN